MNSPTDLPRTVPRRDVGNEGMGVILAVVGIAAIMIVGLSLSLRLIPSTASGDRGHRRGHAARSDAASIQVVAIS
jgi:hypothetical protein